MGMDFIALLSYQSSLPQVGQAISLLEKDQHPNAIRHIALVWRENGFFKFNFELPNWVSKADSNIMLERPSLPSLSYQLRTPEGFFLTFGRDTICVYHLLRWRFFLTDLTWQKAMLKAVAAFCEMFAAEECIITSDFSPAYQSFFKNNSFAESLEDAEAAGEGEVEQLVDLYQELEEDPDSDIAIKPYPLENAKSIEAQYVLWPRSKPLPERWVRPTIWDSKGYWHFSWRGDRGEA